MGIEVCGRNDKEQKGEAASSKSCFTVVKGNYLQRATWRTVTIERSEVKEGNGRGQNTKKTGGLAVS